MTVPIAQPIIGDEEEQAVLAVLRSGQLAQGHRVREFEEHFAAWCGTTHAVAVSSGTAALHLALLAHDIGGGDEVITTPFSFVASANCVLFVGATPVFADIEPVYYTIDPDQVKAKITRETRAIIAVHLYGQPCDMAAICQIADTHGLTIIEDACQAHGASFQHRNVGSFGTACYSFYPTKNMTTGEGGIVTTNDATIADRVRCLRDHGSYKRYHHELLGYNLRMTDMQAAIGLVQLTKVDGWNAMRQHNAACLTAMLSGLPGICTPQIRPDATHVFHQYTIRAQKRSHFVNRLVEGGIGVGIHYPTPIHKQPLYSELGYRDHLPHAEQASQEVLSLPVHPAVSAGDLTLIAERLAQTASSYA